TLRDPAAMHRSRLSGKTGAGLDPCGAIQITFDLGEEQQREVVFRLGAADNADATRRLVQRFRGSAVARDTLDAVVLHWLHTLTVVQVETPDAALNVLINGWLVYPTIACRLWARSGHYQAGGGHRFPAQIGRMGWACSTRTRGSCARISFSVRAVNFPKATSSTGGIRSPAAA